MCMLRETLINPTDQRAARGNFSVGSMSTPQHPTNESASLSSLTGGAEVGAAGGGGVGGNGDEQQPQLANLGWRGFHPLLAMTAL